MKSAQLNQALPVQTIFKFLTFTLLGLTASGCALLGPAHSYLTISGNLLNESGEKLYDCSASIKEISARAKKVGGEFSAFFIVGSKNRDYSVQVICAGYQQVDRSFAGFKSPIDLGDPSPHWKNSTI